MFLSHYNLKINPFQITPDSKFLWLGENHQEALSTLKYGIRDNKGFLLITGDVGTGKTTLINALVNSLEDNVIVGKIVDPFLNKTDFYKTLASIFHLKAHTGSKGDFLREFSSFLHTAYKSRKQILLIVDEAQRFQSEMLEEIRVLSNIEKEHTKLLNIFFVGQVVFNDILLRPENNALRQRITANYNLEHLSEKDTGYYVAHRLKVAGATQQIFLQDALREIYCFSSGAPRLINIICDRALLTGYAEEKDTIDAATVKECAQELEIKLSPHVHNEDRTCSFPAQPDNDRKRAAKPDHAFTVRDIKRTKNASLSVYFVYIILILLILGAITFFFFSPDDLILFLSGSDSVTLVTPAGGNT